MGTLVNRMEKITWEYNTRTVTLSMCFLNTIINRKGHEGLPNHRNLNTIASNACLYCRFELWLDYLQAIYHVYI